MNLRTALMASFNNKLLSLCLGAESRDKEIMDRAILEIREMYLDMVSKYLDLAQKGGGPISIEMGSESKKGGRMNGGSK